MFYAYDGLGSVAALSNHQGKRKTRYQYDAFGEVLVGDLSDNSYAFTGKRLEPESGLYHFHFRKYDAEVGVWTTADPSGFIFDGPNLYQYVRNNPVSFNDILGLFADTEGMNDISSGSNTGEYGEGNDSLFGGLDKEQLAEDVFGPTDLTILDWSDVGPFIDDYERDVYDALFGPVDRAVSKTKALLELGIQVFTGPYVGRLGSYTIKFASGMSYIGKGLPARMRASARSWSARYNDPVESLDWGSAKTHRQAFKDEYQRMVKLGVLDPKNDSRVYNRIQSPGKKYCEADNR